MIELHPCGPQRFNRVPTAQGKQGKWQKTGNLEILSKRRENTGNFLKTQGILLAQVVNVLILKVKDIAIVSETKSIFFQKLDRSVKSVLCM